MLIHELALGPDVVAAPHPDALLLPDGSWSRDELRAAVADMASPLATLAPPGGRIALAADNRPEVVALLLAIPAAGRVAVPLDVRRSPDGMLAQLTTAGASSVIGTAEQLGRLAPVLAQAPSVRTCVGLDPGAGDISLTALVAAPTTAVPPPSEPDAPAWILFTGPDATPHQGAVLTSRSLGDAVTALTRSCDLPDDAVYLHAHPLPHMATVKVLHALHRGRPVVLPTRCRASDVADMAARHRATVVAAMPPMLQALLDLRSRSGTATALTELRTVADDATADLTSLFAADLGVDVRVVDLAAMIAVADLGGGR